MEIGKVSLHHCVETLFQINEACGRNKQIDDIYTDQMRKTVIR